MIELDRSEKQCIAQGCSVLCLVIIKLGQTKWDYSSDSSPPVLQYMAYQAGQPVVYGGWCSPPAKVGCLFHFPKSLLHLFLLLLNYCLCKRSLPVGAGKIISDLLYCCYSAYCTRRAPLSESTVTRTSKLKNIFVNITNLHCHIRTDESCQGLLAS